ncbi:potassium transporter TrkH [Lujinxingia litoralis]|uniref:Potassium transporter TrkH n=1 Tax=Lujinxingia litoralis TaxID=2211119 RepID=A0A328C4N8_9DELT|nr:potassium transporter TrkG [Lujinxingia litoralis]RAL21555.1 potassium transporter TrkH [Lujinxingia litoralis]
MLTRPSMSRALLRAGAPSFVLAWGSTFFAPRLLSEIGSIWVGIIAALVIWMLTSARLWQRSWARALSLGTTFIGLAPTLLVSATRPGPAFLWALGFLLGGYWLLWLQESEPPDRGRWASTAVGASLGMVAVWLSEVIAVAPPTLGMSVVGASILAALALMGHCLWRCGQAPRELAGLGVVLALTGPLLLAVGASVSLAMSLWALVVILLTLRLWALDRPVTDPEAHWWEPVAANPARLLAATFLATCMVGGLFLAIPQASTHSIDLIDAFFTAVSATCVTGLVVLDTASDFSTVGQLIILALIQIGGLGIMTFSTAAFLILGKRLSMRHEGAIAQLIGERDRGQITDALRLILIVTFASEALGALILSTLWWLEGLSPSRALWEGIFTAISAFCNAGFALRSDSLVSAQNNPAILMTVGALIAVGGLGPAVVASLPRWWRGRSTSLHVRIVLTTSVLLWGLPAIFFFFSEAAHSFENLTLFDRIFNALFQSITLRTAGFNSVDFTLLHPGSVLIMIIAMFIGGSPGSTAGGIKTTTLALLFLVVKSALANQSEVEAFGYRIPQQTIFRSAAIATVGAMVGVVMTLALLITQHMPFMVAIFETLSALGTVGLSIGGTAMLDNVGKIIVMLAMFIGRIGPLTLFLLLASRPPRAGWNRPTRGLPVG